MRSIVSVNTYIPGHKEVLAYDSGESFLDYDIILIDPEFPYYERQHFTAGGSCISIDASRRLLNSIAHWKGEIRDALDSGKTIFFLLNERVTDQVANSASSPKKGQTTYHTSNVNNYDILPFSIDTRNARGSKIKPTNSDYSGLFKALEKYMKYQVVIDGTVTDKVFTTKDGKNLLGAVVRLKGSPGNIVLLPYFDLSSMTELNNKDEEVWTKEAMGLGTALKKQMLEIDRKLGQQSDSTPRPDWLDSQPKSLLIEQIKTKIVSIESDIKRKEESKVTESENLAKAEAPAALLYENGKPLELAIEAFLKSLGYEASNYTNGNIEIDHIIVSPKGKRFIGEAEGKDKSAVGIDKFRQLETNINEDFRRDDVAEPAMGILFGNGFRLQDPKERPIQFTDKCLTNAQRLSTILVQTADLYPIAVYLQDHPNDEAYKAECRSAIESSGGKIVAFPSIPGAQSIASTTQEDDQ